MYRTVLFSFSFKIMQKLSVEWQGGKKGYFQTQLFSGIFMLSIWFSAQQSTLNKSKVRECLLGLATKHQFALIFLTTVEIFFWGTASFPLLHSWWCYNSMCPATLFPKAHGKPIWYSLLTYFECYSKLIKRYLKENRTMQNIYFSQLLSEFYFPSFPANSVINQISF